MSAVLLDDVCAFVRRFVVLTDTQATAATLWVAHTHGFEAFEATPYLAITSPEKRSGKTRLLEVLELLVREPLSTANISDAALFRVIEEKRPTLLVDEVDAIFGRRARDREELRGILNAGYRRGAVTHRMGGKNFTDVQSFGVFCPKAFAGIGNCLPDTISDRSVPIKLSRRTRGEPVARFRRREVEPEGWNLRDRLANWIEPQHDYLVALRPTLPDELDDRAQDVWEPLLAMAELASPAWAERARLAAVALSSGGEREDESVTAQLIRDVHGIFRANGDARLKTSDLLAGLHRIEESPWGEWHGGKPLSPHGLSRLLKPYRIRTMPVRAHGDTVRGYKAEQFEDAFARLELPVADPSVTGVTGVISQAPSHAGSNASNACNASPSEAGRVGPPLIGDDGFLEHLYAALEAGHITEGEWHEASRAHRFVLGAAT